MFSGVLTSGVAYENKKTGQYTGFNLTGYKADPTFDGSGGDRLGRAGVHRRVQRLRCVDAR